MSSVDLTAVMTSRQSTGSIATATRTDVVATAAIGSKSTDQLMGHLFDESSVSITDIHTAEPVQHAPDNSNAKSVLSRLYFLTIL